jgi:hypothetical protein
MEVHPGGGRAPDYHRRLAHKADRRDLCEQARVDIVLRRQPVIQITSWLETARLSAKIG